MKLHVESLGTFYEMAREGAGVAAGRLTRMTGIETRVGVTRLDFVDQSTLRAAFGTDQARIGIRVELDQGLPGTSVILFGEETAETIVEKLRGNVQYSDSEEFTRSAIVEVAQVMNNGFVDGWADVLRTSIDVSAPEYVTETAAEDVLGNGALDAAHDDLALIFHNSIEAVGTHLDFHHYLIPEHDAMAPLLARQADSDGIEHQKLAAFDRMAERGAGRVADSLSRSAGMDFEIDFRRINFLSLDAIPEAVSNERHVSVAFSFDGILSGYLLFLFDEPSARELVTAAVNEEASAFDGIGRDAVKELSNIMASGLLDGWANLLDETIHHSTPAYTYDMGAAVIDPLIVGLSDRQEFAFVFDTHIHAVDSEFDVEIYAIPDEGDLERVLSLLDVERAEEAETIAEFAMGDLEADPETITTVDGNQGDGTDAGTGTSEHDEPGVIDPE